jgi:hypothetical protein
MLWLAERLSQVRGVVAVALGGSRAQGTERTNSYWDFSRHDCLPDDTCPFAHTLRPRTRRTARRQVRSCVASDQVELSLNTISGVYLQVGGDTEGGRLQLPGARQTCGCGGSFVPRSRVKGSTGTATHRCSASDMPQSAVRPAPHDPCHRSLEPLVPYREEQEGNCATDLYVDRLVPHGP